nr:helix-turn-helix transcriptional regulator [Acuticoccus mangrovi]
MERALGAHVRRLRRQRDLSVADLAHACGLSIGMLSKIENGQTSPSLTSLQALAGALNVPLSTLFSEFEEERDCSFVPAGQGVHIERRGTRAGHVYELLGHALNGDITVEPYLISFHDDAQPYTGFQHAGAELIHMLEGEVVYLHGAKSYHLRPGDTLLFNPAAAHGPAEFVVRPTRYLSIIVYPREL